MTAAWPPCIVPRSHHDRTGLQHERTERHHPLRGLAAPWHARPPGRTAAGRAARRVPGAARFRHQLRIRQRDGADADPERLSATSRCASTCAAAARAKASSAASSVSNRSRTSATRSTFLAKHPAVDPDRIGVIGSSFGGAVAVYAAGVNPRIAATISNGGWGHGERKFRGQHPTPGGLGEVHQDAGGRPRPSRPHRAIAHGPP